MLKLEALAEKERPAVKEIRMDLSKRCRLILVKGHVLEAKEKRREIGDPSQILFDISNLRPSS